MTESNPLAQETTFDRLWDEAMHSPGHPFAGRLPDGWDGWVHCAIQLQDDDGAVVLDFPADRLIGTIAAAVADRDWRVARKQALRLAGADGPLRYVMTVHRKTPVSELAPYDDCHPD